jgi:phage gpG-like protein
MRVTATVTTDEIKDAIASRQGRIDAMFEAAADILRKDFAQQFARGGDPTWAPLSPKTVAEKRRQGYPRRDRKGEVPQWGLQNGAFGPENILMRTGALFSSWTDGADLFHLEERDGDVLRLGSTLPYAPAMQYGVPSKNIPARPIRITDAAVALVAAEISQQMQELI